MAIALTTRRQFLAAGAALPFAWRTMAQGKATPQWVLLGTDKGKGIYRAQWNAETGELGAMELAVGADRPDFFALHPKLPVMYTVNSVGSGKGAVSSFRVDAHTGTLTQTSKVSSFGDGPCYVSVDRLGTEAFVANYTGGSVACFALHHDGTLYVASSSQSFKLEKPGAVPARQDASHMHCTVLSPRGNFVLACDLGADLIRFFSYGTGPKESGNPPVTAYMHSVGVTTARAGSGPRHVAFHPNGKWVYCIHEIDCTVDLYDWSIFGDAPRMKLREDSVVSTLSKGTALAGNTACEIFVSNDGRFLYTCTRGVDEIVIYRINQAAGLLTEQQRVSSGGKIPRYFALDPSRKWLVCCNQGVGTTPVGNVTVFAHNAATGRLSEKPKNFAAETPMFVEWV